MPKKNPKNFWDDERRNSLRELFNSKKSDAEIKQELNKKFGAEFNNLSISAKRRDLGLTRERGGVSPTKQFRKNKTAAGKSKLLLSNDLVFKFRENELKKNELVYIPGQGVSQYMGLAKIGEGSAASGLSMLTFITQARANLVTRVLPGKLAETGIRALITKKQAKEIEKILSSPAKPLSRLSWHHLSVELDIKKKSSDFRVVAELARDMMAARSKETGDIIYAHRIRGKDALDLLAREHALAMKMRVSESYEILEKAAQAPKKRTKKRQPTPEMA